LPENRTPARGLRRPRASLQSYLLGLLTRGVRAPELDPAAVDEIARLREAIERISNERRTAIDHLARKVQETETASRAKDEFLAMLGHELRNPMNAIATSVEVLSRLDADSPVAARARAVIARQTRKLARIIDELLDIGRLLTDDASLLRQPLMLAQVVRGCLESARPAAIARNQVLQSSLADCWVHADSQRMAQVVDRLLDNACKYSPAGATIEITLTTESAATPAGGASALLRVSDTGPGIAADLLPCLFEPFSQGARGLDRREGGLGIGLTVVRRVVELHGGAVSARNRPADDPVSGAIFELRLPIASAPDDSAAPLPARSAAGGGCSRVAVIEDNADALCGLRSMLELDGHAVQTAVDGETGLALLLRQAPDIAIVDIGLPGIDGYELARRSRAEGYRGRLIALSGYGRSEDFQRSAAAGFEAHLVKPVVPEQLQRLLAGT
jgi:signal transduction histidine kinase